jgi:hypothetical protein
LFKTAHRQTIRFIDDYQCRWVRDRFNPCLVFVEGLVVRRLERQRLVWVVISVLPVFDTPSLVPTAENIKRRSLFYTSRSLGHTAENAASAIYVGLNARRRVDNFRGEEHCVDRPSIGSLCVPAV